MIVHRGKRFCRAAEQAWPAALEACRGQSAQVYGIQPGSQYLTRIGVSFSAALFHLHCQGNLPDCSAEMNNCTEARYGMSKQVVGADCD